MSNNLYAEMEHCITQLFNRYSELSKRSYEYCEGVSLYQNEIRTMEYIAVSSTTNLTDIANQTGLTRGAVSKMIVKLEGMGLLVRYKYHPKQKEIYVHLTQKGVLAYEGYKLYRSDMDEQLYRYFHAQGEEEQRNIVEFLAHYLNEMNRLPG